jgi:pyridoxal phosphate enzyme (YggS family)
MTSSTSVAMTIFPASSADHELLERVAANLALLEERIASTGRDPQSVRVVAVTKTFSLAHVRAAYEVGLRDVGENYVDELCEKRGATPELDLHWHFLGALQTNKIPRIVRCADLMSGVSRTREVDVIAKASPASRVDVQVDFTGEGQRNGAAPHDVAALVEYARSHSLDVRGLMVVAPVGETATRDAFLRTRDLADELGLLERSMGMSDDIEIACELGSTEVRVGRALFGARVV